jgi:hypothetical protein
VHVIRQQRKKLTNITQYKRQRNPKRNLQCTTQRNWKHGALKTQDGDKENKPHNTED